MSRTPQRATPQGTNAAMFSAFEQAAGAAKLGTAAGKSAVDKRYRALIDSKDAKTRFTGSVDMDAAFSPTKPDAHRWDFGLGVQVPGQPECAIWVEPHSAASTGEVKTMLAKLDWLQAKLQQPAFAQLQALTQACARQGITPFHWLATAHVALRPGSREARLLAQRGLHLPRSKVVI